MRKRFFRYVKERSIWLVFLTVVTLVYLAVAGLYGYDGGIRNMLYAAHISFFFLAAGCAVDFAFYARRCMKLEEALAAGAETDYCLPAPKGAVERLYYEMLCQAKQVNCRLVSELDSKTTDMADYYAMWIHQVKTPIAALHLLFERMEECRTAEGAQLRQASEELFKIEQYAEMALHYARLDGMSADMLLKEYDIAAIAKKAVKKYSVLFIGKGLSFSMGAFTCKAVTDEKWLGLVMEQLLANALKYTNAGGIRLYGADESGMERTGEADYVVMEDTGIGIREEDLPRIFERGFTGYNGRMDKKSTGIGLYLCKRVMEQLGHTLRVESAQGQGCRVVMGFGQFSLLPERGEP